MDDWARRKGQTYRTIVIDLERRHVLDLLADRSADTLAAWLREHPGITVVARDRSSEYARAVSLGAEHATEVADHWHLLANTREMVERWLVSVSGRLRRLPPILGDAPPVPGRRIRAFPRCRTDQADSAASRERARSVYEEVRRRRAAGETLLGIARAMGLARGTVRKYARTDSYPERVVRAPGPSVLDPFIAYLETRVAAGCENGMALWRELQERSYTGKARRVHLWVQERRTKPVPSTPRRHATTPAPPTVDPPLPSPKRLAWALVKPETARDAEEAAAVARVEQDRDPDTATVAGLARRFTVIVRAACATEGNKGDAATLNAWLVEARSCGVRMVETFAAGLEQDGAAVRAALTTSWSSGQAEGQINKLKLLKRQMYGRADLDLLRRRTLPAA